MKAKEEAELAEIAAQASAAMQEKRAARARQLQEQEVDSPEPPSPVSPAQNDGPGSSRSALDAPPLPPVHPPPPARHPPGICAFLARAHDSICRPPSTKSTKFGDLDAMVDAPAKPGAAQVAPKMAFNTQSVQDKVRQKEKQVQRTMDLLRALENAKLETDTGYVQLQGAMRPRSYTHELLKGAGLKYRRGKPVFHEHSGPRRSASALSYYDEHSGSRRSSSALSYYDDDNSAPRRYRAQGSSMAVVNRRTRSTTPSDHPGQKMRSSALSNPDASVESEGARGILRASSRPSTLAPLPGRGQTPGLHSLSISLPVLCKLKSSETAALTEATRELTEEELKQGKLDADLDDDDPLMEEPTVIAKRRLQASQADLARGIALGVTPSSLLLTTKSTRSTIEQHVIHHDGEARDVMRRVENILGDVFGVDIRDHCIPIRVTSMLPEVTNTSILQKSRLNAHTLDCAPRAVCVKSENSLPQGMGRQLHSAAYYMNEESAAAGKVRVAQAATELASLRESVTELSHKRRKHTDPHIREEAEAEFKAAVEAVENKEAELLRLRGQLNSVRPPAGGLGGIKLPPMDHQWVKADVSVARAHQRVHRDVHEILVLGGMSSYQLAGEVAKAIGSAFLFLEHYDGLDSHTEGAFCELCSYVLAREEKSQLMKAAGVIHEKIAELEGELKYTEEELKVLEQHVQEAHKEREEADEAELHAKHTVKMTKSSRLSFGTLSRSQQTK